MRLGDEEEEALDRAINGLIILIVLGAFGWFFLAYAGFLGPGE